MTIEKKDVRSISLIKAGTGYNKEYRASYNRYRVIVNINGTSLAIEDIFKNGELSNLGYWSTRSNMMAMQCWGTSQSFEAQLALARWLGWDKPKREWGEYTRDIADKINIF